MNLYSLFLFCSQATSNTKHSLKEDREPYDERDGDDCCFGEKRQKTMPGLFDENDIKISLRQPRLRPSSCPSPGLNYPVTE